MSEIIQKALDEYVKPKFNQKQYAKKYHQEHKEERKQYAKKYRQEHKEERKQYAKKYRQITKEKRSKYMKLYNKRKQPLLKKMALSIIDPRLKCIRCGCNNLDFIEKNHKNGGGNKESRMTNGTGIKNIRIINGKRKTDDLELLCKPCNSIHYLEMKFGLKDTGLKVVWNPPKKE